MSTSHLYNHKGILTGDFVDPRPDRHRLIARSTRHLTMVLFVLSLACLLGHSVLGTNAAVEDKCEDGYDFFHGDNTCIKVYGYDNRKTWLKAREQCQEEGGDLASIESDKKNTFVTEKLNTENYYWVGIKNTASKGFSFFNVNGKPMTYKNWKQDQPDNWKNNEHCVMMFGNRQPPIRRGKWNDYDCMKALQFVCQRDVLKPTDTCTKYEPDGTCIKVMFEPETWRQANENCEADRGSLVIIDSAEKNDFVTEMLFSSRPFWTGARVSAKEKPQIVIKYVDGQLASYNNGGSQEFCVMMYGKRQPIDFRGVWDDFDCSHKLPYVCQYPPVAKEEAKSDPDNLKCMEGWSLFSPEGTCIKKTDVKLNFEKARASCQEQKDGDLVVIKNEAKNKFVTDKLTGYVYYWIGLHRKDGESGLRYMDGNSLGEYQPWISGGLDRYKDAPCVILSGYPYPKHLGSWTHCRCSLTFSFVCEMPASY